MKVNEREISEIIQKIKKCFEIMKVRSGKEILGAN